MPETEKEKSKGFDNKQRARFVEKLVEFGIESDDASKFVAGFNLYLVESGNMLEPDVDDAIDFVKDVLGVDESSKND